MNPIIQKILNLTVVSLIICLLNGCDFLEPLPDGSYNDENFDDYPELLRGYVDKVYNDYLPTTYYSTYYMGMDAATDDAVYRDENASWRQYSKGAAKMGNNPFSSKWTNNYTAINYLNLFLEDNKGYNTRYLVDFDADLIFRKCQQGSAFGLRAYMLFDLLRSFAGKGTDGNMWGVPIKTEPTDIRTTNNENVKRATVDECIHQILNDCDSALAYLPYNNRDYPHDPPQSVVVSGSARYKTLDQICIYGLKAMVYLFWASDSFNPQGDLGRYRLAAENAAVVMRHKLEVESTLKGGFNPLSKFIWEDCNSPEIVWPSDMTHSALMETSLYPSEFGGSASIVPTQELVDAFPMENGYPITDSRSGYDPENPYLNRDSRFYASILYNGAQIIRSTNSEVMYTIESHTGGKDAPGGINVSPTGYYVNKYLYKRWNPYDFSIETAYRCIHYMSWTKMCLIFAEAANKVAGPTDETAFGYSAKQAIAWLRARPSNEGRPGVGADGDPYLNEIAGAGSDAFDALVKNEWRLETCFEGERFYNLRRWAKTIADLNGPIHLVEITENEGTVSYNYSNVVETLAFPSLWAPIPYTEIRKCPDLIQNEGWESWK